jgi:hypothetical protein
MTHALRILAILVAICAWPVLLAVVVIKWFVLLYDAATDGNPREIFDSILDIAKGDDIGY